VRNFIVVPEGVKAGPDGLGLGEPSFVYRQVLDYTLRLAGAEDVVYLAPANAFGGPLREEEAAQRYLARHNVPFRILYPGFNLPANHVRPPYVDTLDNARLLREALGSAEGEFELVCAYRHTPRALWCFRRTGFQFRAVHRVRHGIEPEPVPARVFYYRFPLLHRLYESAALLRDVLAAVTGWRR
jgi:hypothetical protein